MDEAAADREAFARALDELDRALDAAEGRTEQIRTRIGELRAQLRSDRPVRDIVSAERLPLVVHLLSDATELLHTYGTRVRRTEARVLHREGMTMDQIAEVFGVTRQRVSALLRERSDGA